MPTEVYPESLLTFRTTEPMTISTDRSSLAFAPVRQEDYASDAQPRRPQLARAGPDTAVIRIHIALSARLYGGVGVVVRGRS